MLWILIYPILGLFNNRQNEKDYYYSDCQQVSLQTTANKMIVAEDDSVTILSQVVDSIQLWKAY